jgi:hypothetical protein
MRKFPQILAGLMLIAALLGCSSTPADFSTPTPASMPAESASPSAPPLAGPAAVLLPALSGAWQIKLSQSGGIMGMSRMLDVSSNGDLLVTDLRGGQSNPSRLPADKLAELTSLVAESAYQPASAPAGCADCFIFDLEISSGGERFQVQMNQIDLASSGLQPLVNFLMAYLKIVIK